MDELRFAFGVLQWLVTLAIGLYAWASNKRAATDAQVTAVAARVTTLEEKMQHLPDQKLVHGLAGDMKAVKAELEGVKNALAPLGKSLDRINDYLLSHK